jgi:flagellar biosynthesis protein FlhG
MMNYAEDQASALRSGAGVMAETVMPARLRCLAVASGKGGVGKTFISIGLSCSLAKAGFKVLLFDADTGLANVDIQAGIEPEFTIQDVIFGNCSLADAVVSCSGGPDILPSSTGAPEMVDLGDARRQMFVRELISFAGSYDYLIIDVGAGIGKNITTFLGAVPEVILVVANEPTSLMDAYSLLKVLRKLERPPVFSLVVNMVRSLQEGEQLAHRVNGVTRRFLGADMPLSGIVVYDPCVGDAIRNRRPIAVYAPKSAPARCIDELSRSVVAGAAQGGYARPGKDMFERLSNVKSRQGGADG